MLEFKLFNIGGNRKCIMVSDISTKVNMESRLKASEAHLRELNETKDKIFSIIAHDLRSPFQAIIGFASMLNEGMEGYSVQELKKMAAQITDVSEQTYKLLDDLLTWSKSQLGQLSPRPVTIKVQDLIEKTFGPMNILARKKNISLITDIQEDVAIMADADNTGIGIQSSKQDEIFSLSGNLSTMGTSAEAGTGLGLMLAHQMTELNKGKISLRSEPGKGSCFTVAMDAV
jgi:signal transduction histidine kinase